MESDENIPFTTSCWENKLLVPSGGKNESCLALLSKGMNGPCFGSFPPACIMVEKGVCEGGDWQE